MSSQGRTIMTVLWTLVGVWSALVVSVMISVAFDEELTSGESTVDTVVGTTAATVIAIVPPAALVLLVRKVLLRRSTDEAPAVLGNAGRYHAGQSQVGEMPPRLQDSWHRLLGAWEVLDELRADHWVAEADIRGLEQSIARLHGLAVVDGRTDRLGGRQSIEVEQQIHRLAALMIGLADEVVEHRAVVEPRDPVPTRLAAAAQRLATDRIAYRELMELGSGRVTF